MTAERNARVAELLRDPRVWTASDLAAAATVSTGYAPLDAILPGGGWPLGSVIELLHERPGIGELTLLAPALAQLSNAGKGIALIGAPYCACGPAWAGAQIPLQQLLLVQAADAGDRLWAAEQALRSGAFGAVLLWPRAASAKEMRRLQLAAGQGGAMAFLFRPLAAAQHSSPAALRLRLTAGLAIEILKSRGGPPRALSLALPGRSRSRKTHSNVVAMPVSPAPAARCAG
jgi:cell division inhibitor SulA/protein ImuA